jgi:adenine-specific DNA glycosylase
MSTPGIWIARGRNVQRHGGVVPMGLEAIESLPGVGPHTARAVAAHAHGVAVAAVDVNVRRVLARPCGTMSSAG